MGGEGLVRGGEEAGRNLYGGDDVPGGTLVAVSVSGTAPPPSANAAADEGQQEQGQQGRDTQQAGGETAGVSIQAVPGRLDGLRGDLIAGFAVLFAMGAILLGRKPGMEGGRTAAGTGEGASVNKKECQTSTPAAPAAPGAPTKRAG